MLRPERHAAGGRAAGRDQPPVQEQPRRHVHRRHREGRPDAHRLGVGRHRRRLRQRRLRRPVHHLLRPQRALSQQRRRHVHRRDREGRPAARPTCATAPAARGSTTTATAASICSSPTTSTRRSRSCPSPARTPTARWKGVPVNCGPRGLPTGFVQLFHNNGDGTFTDVSRQSGVAAAAGVVSDDRGGRRLRQRRLARHLRRLRFHAELAVPQPARRHVPRGGARARRGAERGRPGAGRHGRRASATTTSTATSTSSRPTSPTTRNVLYRNDGKGYFDDVTIRAGLGVETRFVGWGAGMVDLDNDGLPDLFMVTGSVYPEVEQKLPAYPFRDAAPGLPQPGRRQVRGADRRSRARRRRRALQPRLRLRRLRQRRRRRHPRHEHERAAVAAAQRRHRRAATG